MIRFISRLKRRGARLLRREDGNATVEFMLVVPVYLTLMTMSLELSMITLRQTMLERGLDIAVRDIRLGTGTSPTHDGIKRKICDEAMIINDCMNSVRLEMIPSDMRNLTTLGGQAQCTDRGEQGAPVLTFTPGQQNQLMFLRACAKFDPLFPTWQLARTLQKDSGGQVAIVTMSAFVQEPL